MPVKKKPGKRAAKKRARKTPAKKRSKKQPASGWTRGDGKPARVRKTPTKKPSKAKGKGKGGRPRKDTPDRVDLLLAAAEKPLTNAGVARAAGISESSLYEYLNKNPEFSERFTRARSRAEVGLVEDVADEDPKFLLERSFGYVKRVELTGKDGDPLRLLTERLQKANQKGARKK